MEMVKITINVPKELRIKIRESAGREDRSMSAEILARLESVYMGRPDLVIIDDDHH